MIEISQVSVISLRFFVFVIKKIEEKALHFVLILLEANVMQT